MKRLKTTELLKKRLISSFACILILATVSGALTRWSSLQTVPDADLLEGGKFLLSAQGYYFSDLIEKNVIKPVGMVNFGIIEWVNIQAGYTGGTNLGLKARILGETRPWMPSLALGVQNIFTHRDGYIFDRLDDSLGTELYLALGKSVEPIRLRFHFGLQSIPDNEQERINPYAAIEKYFGMGLYVTVEAFMREREMHPSVFASWRFLKRRLEVSAGIIDVVGMFFNKDEVPPGSPFYRSSDEHFVRPGVWVGIRFLGGLKFGRTDGIRGLEDKFQNQSESITGLRAEIDSLKSLLRSSSARIENMNRSITALNDSSLTDEGRMRGIAIDRLAMLKTLYDGEPFDPVAVNKTMTELVAHRDRMLPALYAIALDPVQETKIRSLAITAMGEIGTQAAADVIIEILGQSPNPEMTIECLIALGKMKETRAVYLMQQLANNPNDDIAFTAAEVLQKLEKETGVAVTPVPEASLVPTTIPENKIGSGETYEQKKRRIPKPMQSPKVSEWKDDTDTPVDSSFKRVEPVKFKEATVADESQAGRNNSESALPVVKNTAAQSDTGNAAVKPPPEDGSTMITEKTSMETAQDTKKPEPMTEDKKNRKNGKKKKEKKKKVEEKNW